jgi:acyl-coenzyme A synthetase/AMP-(fatty) acid ligase
VGELLVRGPGVAEEFRLPGVDSAVYRTGDLASVTPNGLLRLRGRSDTQLKRGGVRLDRTEIEDALTSHQAVSRAAVGVVHGEQQRLIAFLVGDRVDRAVIRAHLLERLPAVAVPDQILYTDALPQLPNGKIDRHELDRLAGDAWRARRRET